MCGEAQRGEQHRSRPQWERWFFFCLMIMNKSENIERRRGRRRRRRSRRKDSVHGHSVRFWTGIYECLRQPIEERNWAERERIDDERWHNTTIEFVANLFSSCSALRLTLLASRHTQRRTAHLSIPSWTYRLFLLSYHRQQTTTSPTKAVLPSWWVSQAERTSILSCLCDRWTTMM